LWYDTVPDGATAGQAGQAGTVGATASVSGMGGLGGASGGALMGGGMAAGGDPEPNAGTASGGTNLGGQGGTDAGGEGGSSLGTGGSAACQDTADCSCEVSSGHTYWFCLTSLNFSNAEAHCETQGLQLARIGSQSENDFLLTAATQHGLLAVNGFVQIGATDLAVTGEWRWRDGTQFWQGDGSGSPVAGLYSNWLSPSPVSGESDGNKHCAGMLADGTWQNRSCTAYSPAICRTP
jgi:hypothetical protein